MNKQEIERQSNVDCGLTRREILKGSSLALAGLAAFGAIGGCAPSDAGSPSTDTSAESQNSGSKADIGLEETLDLSTAKYDVDVVVVGSGAGGMSAALEAATQGGKVLLVERGETFGGSTAFAEGICGFRSKYQLNNGINYNIDEEILNEMDFSRYLANYALIKRFFSMADEDITWLEEQGVQFHPEPNPNSHTQVFYVGQGRAMIDTLVSQAEAKGATLLNATRAKRLYIEDGKVAGIIVEGTDGEYSIKTKTVILATGGIANNSTLFGESFPFHYDRVMITAAPYHEGDGTVIARSAGGDDSGILSVGWVWCGLKSFDIHSELSTAACNEPYLWINETGKRFIPESLLIRFASVPNAVIGQKRAFSILTQAEVDRLMTEGCTVGWGSYIFAGSQLTDLQNQLDDAKASSPEGFYFADSLSELATALNIDPAILGQTVTDYNAMVSAGVDTEFNKPVQYLREVPESGPFYAFELQPNICSTQGGIAINEECEIVDRDGVKIPGLYGAGIECSYTGFYYNDQHGGDNQAFSVFSGRTSAGNALTYARS
jgi:fumarate reductase flavoprotein subunit